MRWVLLAVALLSILGACAESAEHRVVRECLRNCDEICGGDRTCQMDCRSHNCAKA